MGISLEDVLAQLKELRDSVLYFGECVGYTNPDLETMIDDLEQKLREINERG